MQNFGALDFRSSLKNHWCLVNDLCGGRKIDSDCGLNEPEVRTGITMFRGCDRGGIESTCVITHYRTRVYVYGRVHVRAFARARKGYRRHAGNPDLRAYRYTHAVHARERGDFVRPVPDWFGLPNRYPVPLLLEIRERERQKEEGGCRGYRPEFSAGKSRRGRVFTQDTTIHYVIELNELSPSLRIAYSLPKRSARTCTRANAQARVCVVYESRGVDRDSEVD